MSEVNHDGLGARVLWRIHDPQVVCTVLLLYCSVLFCTVHGLPLSETGCAVGRGEKGTYSGEFSLSFLAAALLSQ